MARDGMNMKTIHKYPLKIAEQQTGLLPAGAELLAIQLQGEQLCLWARINLDGPVAKRTLLMCGTGQPAPDGPHIATVQTGDFVWHFFDGGEQSL